jgi:hypothetical protein
MPIKGGIYKSSSQITEIAIVTKNKKVIMIAPFFNRTGFSDLTTRQAEGMKKTQNYCWYNEIDYSRNE